LIGSSWPGPQERRRWLKPARSTRQDEPAPQEVRLGDLLIEQKLISEAQLAGAAGTEAHGRKLGRVDRPGPVQEQQAHDVPRKACRLFVDLKQLNPDPAVVRLMRGIGPPQAARWCCRPTRGD
jgi:hypothetical protein